MSERWKSLMDFVANGDSQTRYGMGKTGSNISSIKIVIENLKPEIQQNRTCPNPQLRQIQHNYLTKILQAAEKDLVEALK